MVLFLANLTTFMCWLSRNSGNLNVLKPSGSVQACIGISLPFLCTQEIWHPSYKWVQSFWPVEEIRNRQMGLLGVVQWRGVGVYVLGTSVWQGELYLWRWREGLDQTWCCPCVSDSLLAYRLKISPSKNNALYFLLRKNCGRNLQFTTKPMVKFFQCTGGSYYLHLQNRKHICWRWRQEKLLTRPYNSTRSQCVTYQKKGFYINIMFDVT